MEQYEKKVEASTLLKTVRIFENHILPAYGNFRVEKMTIDVCQRPVDGWAAKLECAKRIKLYASMVMKFAIKRGYIQSNPFDHVEVIKPKKRFSESEEVKENFYSRTELIEFLEYAKDDGNDKVFTYFRVLAFTGM